MLSGLWPGPIDWRAALTAIAPTLLVGVLAALLVKRVAERVLHAALGDHLAVSSPHVQRPLRLVAAATFVIIAGLVIVPALELAGLRPDTGVTVREFITWMLEHGIRVLV